MEGLPRTAPAHSENFAQETASGGLRAPTREGMWAETGQPDSTLIPRSAPPTPAGAQGALTAEVKVG